MKSVGLRAVIVGVCFWALAAAGRVQYKFSAAGTYPGSDYSVPLGVSKRAIVGYYIAQVNNQTIQGAYIETREQGSDARAKFTSVRPFDSLGAFLQGVNANDVAVGGYCPLGCDHQNGRSAFIYDRGAITSFNYPRVGQALAATVANGINNSGQIVGGFCDTSFVCPQGFFNVANHGFLDDHGKFTQLDYPGTVGTTQAFAINDAGQIVGDYEINESGPYGFLYANGKYQAINYPNALYTVASAINNHGVIAGLYEDQKGQVHGFTDQNGTFTEIDHPNALSTGVTGINDRGIIVGLWSPEFGQYNFIGIPVQ